MKAFIFSLIVIFTIFIGCSDTTKGAEGEGEDVCENIDCGSHGECEPSASGNYGICRCDEGYLYQPGEGCINPCEGEQCSPNGECIPDGTVGRCECYSGYYANGLRCVPMTDLCEGIICEGGECNPDTGDCVCPAGYHLVDGNSCIENQGCESGELNCGDHGECEDDIEGDVWCNCDSGYNFDGTTCIREQCPNGTACGLDCCGTNEVCMGGVECKPKGDLCEDDFGCGANQFCDTVLGNCLEIGEDQTEVCQNIPDVSQQMNPLVAWSWDGSTTSILPEYKHVLMPPVVANINDDNGDGVVNLKDTPDVIFSSYPTDQWDISAILRVVSGDDGSEVLSITEPKVNGGSGIAVGDIDNDGFNEIVTLKAESKKVVAFNHDGTLLWEQDTELVQALMDGIDYEAPGAPAIADIDHDGNPEVLIGKYILNGQDGEEICHSEDSLGSYGNNSDYPLNGPLSGNFPHRRYITVVQDMNGDGVMDIVTGNLIISGSNCSTIRSRADRYDGYTAIGDLNWDGQKEIVVVSHGYLYIYDQNLNDLVTPFKIDDSFEGWNGTEYPIGGAPTIANFVDEVDGVEDINLEIAVAGAYQYQVLKPDLDAGVVSLVWEHTDTKDSSSRQTGSSLFDFEGDGKAEVLYADECYFRIYEGDTGDVRFEIKNSSATIFEYPIVVDVDGDGKSEIVVAANASYQGNECPWGNQLDDGNFGIRVFEDANNEWVRTRRIWNQHSYHITNVTESGKIPRVETPNWVDYNNYRLNSQGKGVFNAPNFTVERVDVKRVDCPELKFIFNIKVANLGSISVPAGVPVAIYRGYLGPNNVGVPQEVLGVTYTETDLWPGRRETITFEYTPANPDEIRQYNVYVTVDDYGNGTGAYSECDENNNSMETSFKGAYGLFCQTGIGQCMRFDRYRCDENGKLVCGAVEGEPVAEICDDGLDNNCDGRTDEDCGCQSGATQECYSGYATHFDGDAKCSKGTQTCIGGEQWTECTDDVLPTPEICNGIDDDCDGVVDETFNVGQPCSVGLGECKNWGTYECDTSGNVKCNAVAGEPEDEICNDGLDNNCNGIAGERPCREQ